MAFDFESLGFDIIPRDSYSGIEILGFPIGSDHFKSTFFKNTVDQYRLAVDKVRRLDHSQSKWTLFNYVLQAKMTHLFRFLPPPILANLSEPLEDADYSIIKDIFLPPFLPSIQWESIEPRLKLKIIDGGLGCKNYSHFSLSAYLGSTLTLFKDLFSDMENDSIPFHANDSWICSLSNSLSDYFRLIKTPPPTDYEDNIEFIQLSISLIANCPVEEWMYYDFLQLQKKLSDNIYKLLTLPTKPKERYRDRSLPIAFNGSNYANKWLFFVPTHGHYIENDIFTMMLLLNFDLEIIPEELHCTACHAKIDTKCHHLLSCKQAALIKCHDTVRDIIAQFCKAINKEALAGEISIESTIPPFQPDDPSPSQDPFVFLPDRLSDALELCRHHSIDITALINNNKNKKNNNNNNSNSTKDTRADLVVRTPGSTRKTLYMDVQIVNHKAPSFHSMERKELNKIQKHLLLVANANGRYLAPTFDCSGCPSLGTENAFKTLVNEYINLLPQQSRKEAFDNGRIINYWFSKISFSINMHKAMMVLNLLKHPRTCSPEEGNPEVLAAISTNQNYMRNGANISPRF